MSAQSFHLIPTIDKPTRVHNTSATPIEPIIFLSFVFHVTRQVEFYLFHLKCRTILIFHLKILILNSLKSIGILLLYTIYNKLSAKLPQSSHYLAVYFLQTSFLKFSAPVIQYEVQFEILSIPNNTAHECIGLYSCPSRILNSDSSIISYLLENIFYTLTVYSRRLKRIIVLVYTHEVISTKSERKPLKSTI